MYLEMESWLEEKIIKLARTIRELEIDNVEFEYLKENKFFLKVSISVYRDYIEVVHRENSYDSSRADIFRLEFEGDKLVHKWSEDD